MWVYMQFLMLVNMQFIMQASQSNMHIINQVIIFSQQKPTINLLHNSALPLVG